MRTYRALAALLTYPTEELVGAIEEISSTLQTEGLLSVASRRSVERLLRELRTLDLFDLQERYVTLFDRTPSLSLHLFEHVHGDSRDRGQAMVDLIELYRRHGVEIAAHELPDFLPLFLEFLGEVTADEARTMLGDVAALMAQIQVRLCRCADCPDGARGYGASGDRERAGARAGRQSRGARQGMGGSRGSLR
jgi:nitrate reductase delta subunit